MAEHPAAALLLAQWTAGTRIRALPFPMLPRDRRHAYAIAGDIGRLKGSAAAGWKIAATSLAGQRHINVDGPLGARIYADRLLGEGARVPFFGNSMKVAECEFAFTLGRDLPPRATAYDEAEVFSAVDGLRLSIEVPDSRYEDFTKVGADQLIADTACASWLVLSDSVTADWRSLDLRQHEIVASRNGEVVSRGRGEAALGGPLAALTWMANEAARYCGGLSAGQFVTTGTCLTPFTIAPGDAISADYGALGRLTARIV